MHAYSRVLLMITVLLVSYNQGWRLKRAIASVHEQTYEDWELLILDDGSTNPDTLHALDACGMPVKYFHPTMEDRAASVRYATLLNEGAKLTTGDYVSFLSSDDYFMPDRLERMVAKIEDGHDVVYGPQLMVDEDDHEMGVRPAPGVLDDAWHRVDLNSVMLTRAAFDAVGGFTDRPATPELWRQADAEMWRKLTNAGYRFVPVDGDEPTDCKAYLDSGVDARVIAGLNPW